MAVEYREEPCRSALNRVKGMPFDWSLNPYMGCAHRCTFCYVRAFELRADRPSDDRYGRSIRVKVNVVEVLRKELPRPSWRGEPIALGATHGWAKVRDAEPGTREHFREQLARDWPEQLERYGRLYARGAYLRKEAAEPVRALVATRRRKYGIADRRPLRLAPPPEPEQL